MAIMVKAMDVHFETSGGDILPIRFRHLISLLRYQLERRSNSEGFLNIHQPRYKITTGCRFDVMGHNGTRLISVRPEPYEWHPCSVVRFRSEEHTSELQSLTNLV